jgi:hypothetical protein
MEILDDEIVKKITYSPRCQETFKKYSGTIALRIVGYSFFVIFCTISAFVILKVFSTESIQKAPLGHLLGLLFVGVWFSTKIAFKATRDLISNKLNITKHEFLKLEIILPSKEWFKNKVSFLPCPFCL